jgi:hypothetical protein
MNIVREIVSGKRNRLKDGEWNLDLTYITPRILAMSFPANTMIKKMYRNSMEDVANYLQQKHGENFLVFNMSGSEYDTTLFNNNVISGDWRDHHSPTLELLVETCKSMYNYL